ncbi:MAG: sulfite exporter TauE/SafE family protein [Leptolyngbyaceae cyanobacterium T60_A2020_046]|nr:sulfite exporter TauE/SafE family protein [Leptolyngbyaceae cyanobacterium T60_A2020_046]
MLIEVGLLVVSGLFAGVLAGLLGIGGGTVLVPMLVTLGYTTQQAIATSSLAIIITSLSGSMQNWRMGYLDTKQVFMLGLPAVLVAQAGVWLADTLPSAVLLVSFAALLALNIYLVGLRKKLAIQAIAETKPSLPMNPTAARVLTGSLAGFLAGLLGVGGGVIMVPLQMLLLGEPIKRAIQTSLGVIVLTAIAATGGHALRGNVVWLAGLILGFGGLISAQFSTRILPKLSDRTVSFLFRALLVLLIVYTLFKAWQAAIAT